MAAAAYRAGEKLHSAYYGEDSDYTRKGGVICSEILLPPHVPSSFSDRETLWNEVEKAERGKKAQLAYSFDIALQNEFSIEENIDLARQFLLDNFVSRGMVVDFAIHSPDKEDGGIRNPHFHVMCPIRPIEPDGKWGNKQRREYVLDEHEAHFRTVMEEQLRLESSEQIRIRRKRLERNENRTAELKRLFIRIYEDNASGRLSDDRFDMLSLTYETEQKQLEAECITLRQEIEVQERQNENIEKFIQTAHKYVGIDELDGYVLRELVSAIYVDAPDKSSGKRVQHIHIKYDGLGFIPLNELMKEETA